MPPAVVYRSRAPLRLGLAGGGSDVSPYCDRHGGFVLNTTIGMYASCTIVPADDGMIRMSLPDLGLEEVVAMAPALPIAGPFKLIQGVYNRLVRDYRGGHPLSFAITAYSDAPIGSGLGASSTMVVAILSAFAEWLGIPLGEYDLASLAYGIERNDLGLEGGRQDQYAAAFGGTNFMEFYEGERVVVNPLRVREWIMDELEASLILYFTGVSRESSHIIKQQMDRAADEDSIYLETLAKVKQDAVLMKQALLLGQHGAFADILGSSWRSKKLMADGISNPDIERVYDLAMRNGARAGKVSGAGGGGFMMFMVDPTGRRAVERVLRQEPGMVMAPRFVDKGAQSWRTHAVQP